MRGLPPRRACRSNGLQSMSRSVRYYLFSVDGPLRISQRVMNGLCMGRDAMPQYAHTRQKIAAAICELENGKPVRILTVEGSYLDFDKSGQVQESLTRGAFEAMQAYDDLENSNNAQQLMVFDITRSSIERSGSEKTAGHPINKSSTSLRTIYSTGDQRPRSSLRKPKRKSPLR